MHETYVTDELWEFDCNLCGHHWSIGYEVRHAQGFEDDEFLLWSRNGLPAMSPAAGVPCPCCEGFKVSPSRPTISTTWPAADSGESS